MTFSFYQDITTHRPTNRLADRPTNRQTRVFIGKVCFQKGLFRDRIEGQKFWLIKIRQDAAGVHEKKKSHTNQIQDKGIDLVAYREGDFKQKESPIGK